MALTQEEKEQSINELTLHSSRLPEISYENSSFSYDWDTFQLDEWKILGEINKIRMYPCRGGWSEGISKYNILHADNFDWKWNRKFFVQKNDGHLIIGLPNFTLTFWTIVCLAKKIPTFAEFAIIYYRAFCEKAKTILDNDYLFKDHKNHFLPSCKDYKAIIIFEDEPHENEILRFKDNVYHQIPLNQFTFEQLLYRLYCVYPSLVRDLAHPIIFHLAGATKVLYDIRTDFSKGIDLIVNSVKIRSYLDSKNAKRACALKDERHSKKDLNGAIQLKASLIGCDDRIVLPTLEIAKQIIHDINNNSIQKEYIYNINGKTEEN